MYISAGPLGLPGCGTLNGSSKVLNCFFSGSKVLNCSFSGLKGSRFRRKGGGGGGSLIPVFKFVKKNHPKPWFWLQIRKSYPPPHWELPKNYNCNPKIKKKNQPLHLHAFSTQNQRHRHPKTSPKPVTERSRSHSERQVSKNYVLL